MTGRAQIRSRFVDLFYIDTWGLDLLTWWLNRRPKSITASEIPIFAEPSSHPGCGQRRDDVSWRETA
jgi:hypothetical protein